MNWLRRLAIVGAVTALMASLGPASALVAPGVMPGEDLAALMDSNNDAGDPGIDQTGQITQVLQGGISVVAGRGAVAAFDVGAMPDPHVVSRHQIVPQAGGHVEQVPGVAAQPIDHVLEGPEPRLVRLRLFGRVDRVERRAQPGHILTDLAVRGVRQDDQGKLAGQGRERGDESRANQQHADRAADLAGRLRRARGEEGRSGILGYDGLVLDPDARTVTVSGKPAELTSYQFDLLVVLAERAGRVLTRDQIMEAVRGRELEAFDRSIDVHMGRIRAAIEADPKSPKRILTVRGVGYVFAKQQD